MDKNGNILSITIYDQKTFLAIFKETGPTSLIIYKMLKLCFLSNFKINLNNPTSKMFTCTQLNYFFGTKLVIT